MKLFCAACGDFTDREVYVDANGELVATCGCGRFLKFPPTNPPISAPPSNPIEPIQSNETSKPKVSFWRKIFGQV